MAQLLEITKKHCTLSLQATPWPGDNRGFCHLIDKYKSQYYYKTADWLMIETFYIII